MPKEVIIHEHALSRVLCPYVQTEYNIDENVPLRMSLNYTILLKDKYQSKLADPIYKAVEADCLILSRPFIEIAKYTR